MLQWEFVPCDGLVANQSPYPYTINLCRAKVPGGWLVMIFTAPGGLTFYPDPQHTWDGSSLP
jgi:hypothetical protein